MKKMILVAGLIGSSIANAGIVVRSLITVASPLLVPATYYAVKTHQEQQRITEKYKNATSPDQNIEHQVELANARRTFDDYIDGVSWGFGIPINVALLSGEARKLSMPVVNINEMNAEQKVGFFSGLSTYVTATGLLAVVKALKK